MSNAVTTITSTHLWACDSHGHIFFIEDISANVNLAHSIQAFPEAPPTAYFEWKPVKGKVDMLVGSYAGLVCGLRGTVLYLRRGVTQDNPMGESWAKAFCDAADISLGSHCVVRKTLTNQLFIARVDDHLLSTPICLPNWNAVPECTFVDSFEHFVLDTKDNLYIVASTGEVYGCFNIANSTENASWTLVSKPPFEVKSGFSLLSFWRGRTNGGELFSNCSAGSRSFWCLKKDSNEFWQLVLGDLVNAAGETELRTNWKKFNLPTGDKLVQVCADKKQVDLLYATTDEGRKIASYSVLQDEAGRLELPNPDGLRPPWKSLAICQTRVPPTPTKSVQLPTPSRKRQISSLYPKLPTDLCCESGDCEFCKSASAGQKRLRIPKISTHLEGEPPEPGPSHGSHERRPNFEAGSRSHGSILGKRRHSESGSEDEEQFLTSLVYQPKRVKWSSALVRYHFLEGVEVAVTEPNSRRLPMLSVPDDLSLPFTVEQVDTQFNYSFELEHQVLRKHRPQPRY